MMKIEAGEAWLEVFREARYAEGWLGSRSGTFAGFRPWGCILSRGRLISWREGLTTVLGYWLSMEEVWPGSRCFA